MNIIYELNPPKVFLESSLNMNILNQEIDKFIDRTQIILKYVNSLHITDSVLGMPRISSLHGASLIRENIKNEKIILSCSVRTRDRNINSLIQFATQSIFLKIKDLLFIMGDKPQIYDKIVPGNLSKPTDVVTMLNFLGYNNFINLNLSIPNKILDSSNFKKKIQSNPYGLITQSINSIEEVKDLKCILEPYPIKLIPCIMIPSEKNNKAAKMIGLNWDEYKNDILEFFFQIAKLADQVMITSPNDFSGGVAFLKKIKNY
jgi:5,10-methylenetetrahydrofolate reductase